MSRLKRSRPADERDVRIQDGAMFVAESQEAGRALHGFVAPRLDRVYTVRAGCRTGIAMANVVVPLRAPASPWPLATLRGLRPWRSASSSLSSRSRGKGERASQGSARWRRGSGRW